MTAVLLAVGGLLALWGFYVLTTLDAIAAVDVGSHLIIGGAVVAGLAAITRAIDRARRQMEALAPRAEPVPFTADDDAATLDSEARGPRFEPSERVMVQRMEPAAVAAPSQAESGPAAAAERRVPDFLVRNAASDVTASIIPTVLREGVLNGVNYRFYSDGSVESQDNGSTERYPSVEALRAAILERRGPAPQEPLPGSVSSDEGQDRPEGIAASAPEPFVDNHLGRDDIDSVPRQPVEGQLPILGVSRADAIGNDSDIEAPLNEIDRGLQDTDVSLQPAKDDLAPPLHTEGHEAFEEEGLFYGREDEFGYDYAAESPSEAGGERRERWSQTLRMLLRRNRGDAEADGNVGQEPDPFEDPFDTGDHRR